VIAINDLLADFSRHDQPSPGNAGDPGSGSKQQIGQFAGGASAHPEVHEWAWKVIPIFWDDVRAF
jgi:hypothetical protein